MSGLVQRYNGSNISYTDSRFTGWNAGTKKLCVRTKAGSTASDVISYPLTTNTTASQYCHFVVRVNGSNCRLATRSEGTFTSNATRGTTVNSKSSSYQCVGASYSEGYTYTSANSAGASYTLSNTVKVVTRTQEGYNTYVSYYGNATQTFQIGVYENGIHKTTPASEYSRGPSTTSYAIRSTAQRSSIYTHIKSLLIPYASGSMFTQSPYPTILQVIPLGTCFQNNMVASNSGKFTTRSTMGPVAEFGGQKMTVNFSITTSGSYFQQLFLGSRYDGFGEVYSPTTYSSLLYTNNSNYTTTSTSRKRTQAWQWSYEGTMYRTNSATTTEKVTLKASRIYSYTNSSAVGSRVTRTSRQGYNYYTNSYYGTNSTWKISSTRSTNQTYSVGSTTWTNRTSTHNANI